ncbi:MAG: acyloxyacyl hydrolase, partial [Alphaproteobacteria bacterium]|nr:acyloxyacyl hydrolase [Alphaproteobacteria bacterium]
YADGNGKDLGHTIEFRSQLEIGYRFDDRSRLSFAVSHISNASLGDSNPGTEIATIYYHIPIND